MVLVDFFMQLNWLAVGQIILIDLLLGGDNAIVIALACRNLPPRLRFQGILWGMAGAVGIRIALIAFAVTMLQVPYLKMLGGVLLAWIGIKLLADNGAGHDNIPSSDRLLGAIKTIVVADLVMSLDNVIAIASAAERAGGDHQLALVIFGIVVSIPIIIWGSTMVLKLIERFPVVVTLGAALLGYLAGSMFFSDVAWVSWMQQRQWPAHFAWTFLGVTLNMSAIATAVLVTLLGRWWANRVP